MQAAVWAVLSMTDEDRDTYQVGMTQIVDCRAVTVLTERVCNHALTK